MSVEYWEGWNWPLPVLENEDGAIRKPVISDEFYPMATEKHREHLGVDIDYRRIPSDPPFQGRASLPNGTKNFYSPENVPVLCPGPGVIYKIGYSEKYGHNVTIHHEARKIYTFHQHLENVEIGLTLGMNLTARTKLGVMGYPPNHGKGGTFRHLHFEVWGGPNRRATVKNPKLYLMQWLMVGL